MRTDAVPAASATGRRERRPIVIGVPSRNETATVGSVVKAAVEGLRAIGAEGRALLVNADNGSHDGTPAAFAAAARGIACECLAVPAHGTGKGSNVLAIMREAESVGAECVLLLDADVRTVEPSWVGAMLEAVVGDGPLLAAPIYRRNRLEGNTTNHVVSPLMSAVFGARVEQPIAGDFAFNAAFVRACLEHPVPDSAQLYGIDVHLTAMAAREGWPIVQVPLGRKLHNPGFPKILYGSQQVIDSLLHAVALLTRPRPYIEPTAVPRRTVDPEISVPDRALVAAAIAKAARYLSANSGGIAQLFPTVKDLPGTEGGLRIDEWSWAQILADAVAALAADTLPLVRDHLVALYLSRVMTYWQQIEGCGPEAIDELLDRQTAAVIEAVRGRGITLPGVALPSGFEPGYWAEAAQ
jgi:glucosylglycerate synthase